MTLSEKQNRMIAEINALGDCFEQYSYLIYKSSELPPMPEDLRDEEHLVRGCQSELWLEKKSEEGRLYFTGWTDTLILRGVLQVLRDLLVGERIEEIRDLEISLFEKTELGATFTSDRNTGVQTILRMLKS